MSITKAGVIAFCNKAWQSSEASDTTEFDAALQQCLDDLSKLPILRARDDTQDLEAGDEAVAFPTGCLPGGLISMSLTDAAGVSYPPLLALPDGLRQYRQYRDSAAAAGRPEYYVPGDDDRWLIWPLCNADYDVKLEYYRTHPQDLATILFPDACRQAIYTGTVFFEAVLRNNKEYQATWGPLYAREFGDLAAMYPGEPFGAYP